MHTAHTGRIIYDAMVNCKRFKITQWSSHFLKNHFYSQVVSVKVKLILGFNTVPRTVPCTATVHCTMGKTGGEALIILNFCCGSYNM